MEVGPILLAYLQSVTKKLSCCAKFFSWHSSLRLWTSIEEYSYILIEGPTALLWTVDKEEEYGTNETWALWSTPWVLVACETWACFALLLHLSSILGNREWSSLVMKCFNQEPSLLSTQLRAWYSSLRSKSVIRENWKYIKYSNVINLADQNALTFRAYHFGFWMPTSLCFMAG